MNKSNRLIELMMWVNMKKKFTLEEAIDEFQVSRRTVLRDLQELSELGVPLSSQVGPHGGYEVLRNRILPPVSFSVEEALSVFFAHLSLSNFETLPFESDISSAMGKLYQLLPIDAKTKIDSLKDRFSFNDSPIPIASPNLKSVLAAAVEQTVIHIKYDSKDGFTEREIQPIGVYARNGLWYCPAYCFLRKSVREFRVDRIKQVTASEKTKPLSEVTKLSLENWTQYYSNQREHALKLEVHLNRSAVRELAHYADHITTAPDGSGILGIEISEENIAYFGRLFLMMGSEVEVLSPPEVVAFIRKTVEELQRVYGT